MTPKCPLTGDKMSMCHIYLIEYSDNKWIHTYIETHDIISENTEYRLVIFMYMLKTNSAAIPPPYNHR